MSERRDAIVRLLRTRDDHLPLPVHRTEASSGFVHRARAQVTCEDCLANGRVLKSCESCGGRGYVEEQRERDPYAIGAVLPFGFTVDRHEAARERDRQIDVLDRQLARPVSTADELADADAHPYAWELARKRMWRQFDYVALGRALDELRTVDLEALHALTLLYVYDRLWTEEDVKRGVKRQPWHVEPDGAMLAAAERGLAFLDARLPEPLRAPGPPPDTHVRGPLHPRGAGLDAKDLRDAEMVARAREGVDPVELAREFAVSIRTVYRVVNAA